MNKEKLRNAYGVEWFFYLILFIFLMSVTSGYVYYFKAEKQAASIAKAVNSALVYDDKYYQKFSQIGQFEGTKEETLEKVKEVLRYTTELNNQYGAEVLPYFIKESPYYSVGTDLSAKLLINIADIEVEGNIINAGGGIILNDNNLYYLSGEELQEIEDFDLEINYDKFCDRPNDYNSDLMEAEGFHTVFQQFSENSNGSLKNVYYVPDVKIEINDNTSERDYYNRNNNVKDLFKVEYKLNANTKRYIIEEEKTKELVELLIEDYNLQKQLNRHRFYTKWIDQNTDLDNIYLDDKTTNYKINLYKSPSFFFYGNYEGGKNNYGYRIRKCNSGDIGVFYPMYNNSLRLSLYSKIDIPFIFDSKEICFGYDLVLKK